MEGIIMDNQQIIQLFESLNVIGKNNKEFIETASCQHRTLQQSFTKLCMEWLEHCASDEYKFDLRNEASHEIAKQMIEGFYKVKQDDYLKPSQYLPLI